MYNFRMHLPAEQLDVKDTSVFIVQINKSDLGLVITMGQSL